MKLSKKKSIILFTVVYVAIVAVYYILKIPCMFQYVLSIPCPGCGMTRAILSALTLDFKSAFDFHPMFWSIPVVYLYLFSDHGFFRKRWLNNLLLVVIAAGFLVNWVVSIA